MTAYEKPRLLDVEQPELLPCPWCGGTPLLKQARNQFEVTGRHRWYDEWWYIECCNPECDARPLIYPRPSKQSTIAAWNRRADA